MSSPAPVDPPATGDDSDDGRPAVHVANPRRTQMLSKDQRAHLARARRSSLDRVLRRIEREA